MKKSNQYIRFNSGSAISEMPPAMFLLFFFALFPLVNLIFLGVVYTSCASLNTIELREAARTPYSQVKDVLAVLQDNWQSNMLGRMVGIAQVPESNVYYTSIGDDSYVGVSTTFNIKPLLPIPFFTQIPILGKPWSFSINSKCVLENPAYAYE